MKKFLIKICALLTVSSMLIGVVFMSDFATATVWRLQTL